jgi:ABC-type siderophore export system fused ATPase/permease subunit
MEFQKANLQVCPTFEIPRRVFKKTRQSCGAALVCLDDYPIFLPAIVITVAAMIVMAAVIIPIVMVVVPVAMVVPMIIRAIRIRPVIGVAIAETEVQHRRCHDYRGLRADRRRLDVSLNRRLDVHRRRRRHDYRRRRKRDAEAKTHAGLGGRGGPE